eukprot:238417_1
MLLRLFNYTQNPLQKVAICTLKYSIFKDNPPQTLIHFIGRNKLQRHYSELQTIEWTKHDFESYTYSTITYSTTQSVSKTAIYNWIHNCILNPKLNHQTFKSESITDIVTKLETKSVSLLRVSGQHEPNKYLMVTAKPTTNRGKQKSICTGE